MTELVAARGLMGKLDYVVSSHNLEHLPDPIRFLQACGRILKPGETISMALPDRRTGGDYFRPHTLTAEVLGAYWEKRTRPSPVQIFESVSLNIRNDGIAEQAAWTLKSRTDALTVQCSIAEAYRIATERLSDETVPYFDAHCWMFTPASFEVIIGDLKALGLIDLTIKRIIDEGRWEFYVHLVNDASGPLDTTSPAFTEQRTKLLYTINNEAVPLHAAS